MKNSCMNSIQRKQMSSFLLNISGRLGGPSERSRAHFGSKVTQIKTSYMLLIQTGSKILAKSHRRKNGPGYGGELTQWPTLPRQS